MNFPSKELGDLTIDEVAYIHLGTRSEVYTESHRVLSSLGAIIREMRHANTMNASRTFVPLLCSFAILDQIGTCYQDTSKVQPQPNTPGIKRALYNFCGYNLDSAEVKHLYAFRNGLVHDASFTSQDKKGNWYYFRLSETRNEVVRPAARQWNGLANDFSEETTTYVNSSLLQSMSLDAVDTLASKLDAGDVGVRIVKNREELIHKYLLWLKR